MATLNMLTTNATAIGRVLDEADEAYGSGHGSTVGGGNGGMGQSFPKYESEQMHLAYTILLCLGSCAMTIAVESTCTLIPFCGQS